MWPLLLIRHLILSWYMARLVVINGHSKDRCYNEIGLYAQNIDTNLFE